jgi:hypothetical protein
MTTPSRDGWTRCPPGAFARLAANLSARRQRRVWLIRLAWVAGGLLALGGSLVGATVIDGYMSGTWNRPKPVPCAPGVGPQNADQPNEAPQHAPGCR